MASATSGALATADLVVPSNQEDGVSQILNH